MFHVVFNFVYTADLVFRFVIFKTRLKIALPVGIRRKGVALRLHALGVQGDQLLCHILDGTSDAGFCLLPIRTAQPA